MNYNDLLKVHCEDILPFLCGTEEDIHTLTAIICRESQHYDDDFTKVYEIMNKCHQTLVPNGQDCDYSKLQDIKKIIRPFCFKKMSKKEYMKS